MKKYTSLFIVIALTLINLSALAPAQNVDYSEPQARAGDDLEVADYSLYFQEGVVEKDQSGNKIVCGDNYVSVILRLRNNFDNGQGSGYTITDLNVTMTSASNIFPIPYSTSNPYKNLDGLGSPYLENLYNGEEEEFRFKVNISTSSNVGLNSVNLVCSYERRMHNGDDWYTIPRTLSIPIQFRIWAEVHGSSENGAMVCQALDENGVTMDLYAGACNQKIRFNMVSERSVSDVTVLLNKFSGFYFTEGKDCCTHEGTMIGTEYFSFELNVDQAIPPGEHEGTAFVTFTYTGESTEYTRTLEMVFDVQPTPYLTPPEVDGSLDTDDPTNYYKLTEANPGNIPFQFTNNGNVDLRNVEVSLDLSNSQYFKNNDYYYNEGWGSVTYNPLTVELDEMAMGTSKTAEFPLILDQYMAPGRYKIPVEFSGEYLLGGDSTVYTFNENSFPEINGAILGDMKTKQISPYVFILVGEELFNLDCSLGDFTCNPNQPVNIPLVLENNYRNYDVFDVYAEVQADTTSPLSAQLGSVSIQSQPMETLASGSERTATLNANVKSSVKYGSYDIPIVIHGKNHAGDEISCLEEFTIRVVPTAPVLEIGSVDSDILLPDTNNTVTITVMNTGLSAANNVSVFLGFESSKLSCPQSTRLITRIDPGETKSINFELSVSGSIVGTETVAGNVFLTFYDDIGVLYEYIGGNGKAIDLTVSQVTPVAPSKALEISGIVVSDLYSGSDGNVTVKLVNIGRDTLTDVEVFLTFPGSKVWTTEEPKTIKSIDSGDTSSVSFEVHVADTVTGIEEVQGLVHITFYDANTVFYEMKGEFAKAVTITTEINKDAPLVNVVGTKATELEAGTSQTIEVMVMNTGGSAAEDVNVVLVLKNGKVTCNDNIQTIDTLDAGDTWVLKYKVSSSEALEAGEVVDGGIIISYQDETGNVYSNSEDGPEPVLLASRGSSLSNNALILLAIIVIAVILLVIPILNHILKKKAIDYAADRRQGMDRDGPSGYSDRATGSGGKRKGKKKGKKIGKKTSMKGSDPVSQPMPDQGYSQPQQTYPTTQQPGQGYQGYGNVQQNPVQDKDNGLFGPIGNQAGSQQGYEQELYGSNQAGAPNGHNPKAFSTKDDINWE